MAKSFTPNDLIKAQVKAAEQSLLEYFVFEVDSSYEEEWLIFCLFVLSHISKAEEEMNLELYS